MSDDTVEMRWILPGEAPEPVKLWFDALSDTVAPAQERVDHYLIPSEGSLNVKYREGRIEIKRRISCEPDTMIAPKVSGQVESWVKWSFEAQTPKSFPDDHALWLPCRKNRFLRRYSPTGKELDVGYTADLPDTVCQLEFTLLLLAGNPWWTISLEASGSAKVEALRIVANQKLPSVPGHFLVGRHSKGYADWLARSGSQD